MGKEQTILINIRIPESKLDMIEWAAKSLGQSRTVFMRNAAYYEAVQAIETMKAEKA